MLAAIGDAAVKHVEPGELADVLIDKLWRCLRATGIALRVSAIQDGSPELLRRVGDCVGAADQSYELCTATRSVGRLELWSGSAGYDGWSPSRLSELVPLISMALDNARLVAATWGWSERLESEACRRREVELQLRQVQKMDELGQLAGGIAHDFNNLLTVITGYGEMLLAHQGAGDPQIRGEVEEIVAAAERAAGLTAQLLAFSRQQVLRPRVVDAGDLVVEVVRMLQPLIGESIELVTLAGEEPARIEADPGQIQQVLLNLAVNARDAMPSGGTLTIEVSTSRLGESEARAHGELPEGSEVVVLSVSDTGYGMCEDVRGRVFDPFFTTKEVGKGTGLGLSTVYGIVRQSGGHITVESALGCGTTFRIYLPHASARQERLARHRPHLSTARGNETLLVVEDADDLRNLQRRVLELRGYRVLAARTGEEALRLAATHAVSIPLLLTDVVMPHMSGPELAERLMPQRPDMHVLYVSGYAQSSIAARGERFHFLAKPFAPEQLAHKVREVLDLARARQMLRARPDSAEDVRRA
jgi:signal transduction histidine kinase/CheY-like chemotaxis protein